MPKLYSLKSRLIGLGIFLVLFGLGIRLIAALPFAQVQLRQLMAAQQLSIASYVARDVDFCIQSRRSLIGDAAAALPIELLQQPEQLRDWLRAQRQTEHAIDKGLFVLTADGDMLTPYGGLTNPSEFAGSAWFKEALNSEGAVLGRAQREPHSGEPILIIAAPVRDADKRVVAVLAGAIALDTPSFLQRLQNTPLGISGSFLLVAPADQLIIGASNPAMVLQPIPSSISRLFERIASHTGAESGADMRVDADGIEQLSSLVKVPNTGWYVIANTPAAEVFLPITKMRGFIFVSTLVVLVLVVTALLLILPRILLPLTETAQALRDMAAGKRDLAPLAIKRNDEVGGVLLGFNHLVARLRAQEAALKASEARLEFMAYHDALTGLCNRSLLEDRMQQALARAARHGTQIALLFCDLDGFKDINDRFGHDTGDTILREVAARLSSGRRRTDTVARIGGDEFVLLISDLATARDTAAHIAAQILKVLGEPFEVEDKTFRLGVSIGIGLYEGAPISISTLLAQADIAMYQAKRAGKNDFRIFDETQELAPN